MFVITAVLLTNESMNTCMNFSITFLLSKDKQTKFNKCNEVMRYAFKMNPVVELLLAGVIQIDHPVHGQGLLV